MAYSKAINNHEHPHTGQLFSGLRSESRISQIWSRWTNHLSEKFSPCFLLSSIPSSQF